ncbi:hypothetical protein GCM10027161_78120 [Microbispora hainanensis]
MRHPCTAKREARTARDHKENHQGRRDRATRRKGGTAEREEDRRYTKAKAISRDGRDDARSQAAAVSLNVHRDRGSEGPARAREVPGLPGIFVEGAERKGARTAAKAQRSGLREDRRSLPAQ